MDSGPTDQYHKKFNALSYISDRHATNPQMNQKLTSESLLPWYEPSFHWARQCCGFRDDVAKDVVQESFLKILDGRAQFHGKSGLKTWLFSLVRNTAVDYLRKEMRPLPEIDIEEEPVEIDHDFHKRIIQQLPARQAEVLLLVFYHDMTLEQCADVLEISLGSVRTHYDRGKKRLKELLTMKTSKNHG